ncbi:MAG TPA: signal peptidase II [Burkholderiales bacterium]|nr:signal peptidase II [Burkholderiales bacterium]
MSRPAAARVRQLAPWLLLAVVVAALDQTTKVVVQASLQPGARIDVLPFLDLVLVFNTGAAFSFLAGAGGWQRGVFIAIALAAAALIVHLLRRHPEERLFCAGLALILGGALGNLWDRIALGHVVDFVLLHAYGYHWPAFNVADSAITVGAGLLIWDGLFGERETGKAKREA